MSITIKSNPDGVSGAIQVNGVDKVTIGASGITAGSFAPNSIDAAAAALAFSGANQSLATIGYQKLPSGLIIQWGNATFTTGGAAVTFPVAFPTACRAVLLGNANGTGTIVSVGLVSSNGFTASASGNSGNFWCAIGY